VEAKRKFREALDGNEVVPAGLLGSGFRRGLRRENWQVPSCSHQQRSPSSRVGYKLALLLAQVCERIELLGVSVPTGYEE
jgi:hypothetical protein